MAIDLSRTRDRNQRTAGFLDNYVGHRAKIGVIIPSTNVSVEYDCQRILPRGVSCTGCQPGASTAASPASIT